MLRPSSGYCFFMPNHKKKREHEEKEWNREGNKHFVLPGENQASEDFDEQLRALLRGPPINLGFTSPICNGDIVRLCTVYCARGYKHYKNYVLDTTRQSHYIFMQLVGFSSGAQRKSCMVVFWRFLTKPVKICQTSIYTPK